jgi:hypothetical protein
MGLQFKKPYSRLGMNAYICNPNYPGGLVLEANISKNYQDPKPKIS